MGCGGGGSLGLCKSRAKGCPCSSRCHPIEGSEPKAALGPARGETSQAGAARTLAIASRSPSPSPSWPRPCEKPAALVPSAGPCAPRVAGTPGAPKGREDVPTAAAIPAFRGASEPSARIYTGWPFCCLQRIRPLGRLRNDPKPPCFVIKSNPSGLDHGRLLFEIPLGAELGLAAGHGGILPPSLPGSHPLPAPPASLFCVSPLLGGAGGGAGS